MARQAPQRGAFEIEVRHSLECRLHIPIFSASELHRIRTVINETTNNAESDEGMDSAEHQNEAVEGQDAADEIHDSPESEVSGEGESEVEDALQEALSELDRHRDAMLRMQAEMDNQRKRLVRETEKSRKFALERIMKDLLQVHDSLQRGLEVDPGSATVESLREGETLTLKMLDKVLADHSLEVVDPLGEAFDPELHEAMTMAPSEEFAENTVMEVLQKGFSLHGRLIRPAMVVVSRGSQ